MVYPNAVLQIPPDFLTPLWSILFFVMLLTLGLDSEVSPPWLHTRPLSTNIHEITQESGIPHELLISVYAQRA